MTILIIVGLYSAVVWGQLFSTPLHVRFENEVEREKYSPNPKQAPEKTIERQSI